MKLRDVWGSLSSGCGASCGAPAPLKNSHIIYKKRSLVVCCHAVPFFVSLLRLLEPSDPLGHRPIAHAQAVGRCESSDVLISPVSKGVQGIGVRCILQLVAPIDARSAGFTLAMSARTTSTPAGESALWAKPPAPVPPGQAICASCAEFTYCRGRACGFTSEQSSQRGRKGFRKDTPRFLK